MFRGFYARKSELPCKCSAGVLACEFTRVPPGVGAGGGTPPQLAAGLRLGERYGSERTAALQASSFGSGLWTGQQMFHTLTRTLFCAARNCTQHSVTGRW